MRLLLVEDDRMLGESVQIGLQQDGYAVDWVRDAESGRAASVTHRYDVVLLDLGLPKADGLHLLRQLRELRQATPVLILTARDGIAQRVAGLDAGADDYMLKPFDLNELAARIRAVARRSHGNRATSELIAGAVTLDTAARRCVCAGNPVDLTAREFALLQCLMQRCPRIVSRAELEEAMFDWANDIGSNVIEVYIHSLRRKLGRDFINTRRGLGYCIELT